MKLSSLIRETSLPAGCDIDARDISTIKITHSRPSALPNATGTTVYIDLNGHQYIGLSLDAAELKALERVCVEVADGVTPNPQTWDKCKYAINPKQ